ncbi:MAG: DUF421 domain-containing protein [Clostridiaceae bacterium]|nr:DUF421 domain-containing protein [Clostridiaceae bacterium]
MPFVRTLLLYLAIVVAVRLMGKRQVGEMQPTELVVTILVSAVASVPMQDIEIPLAHGIVPILTLIAAEVLLSALSLKSYRFRRLMTGKPVPVISCGQVDQKSLRKLRLSLDDLCEDLRLAGVFDLRQVKLAQVETNGRLSLLLETKDAPATPRVMGLSPVPEEPFSILVSDGVLCETGLQQTEKTREWVLQIIKANGAAALEQVFLLCANKRGDVIFSRKE